MLVVCLMLAGGGVIAQDYALTDQYVVQPGEKLTFRVTYGFFTVGVANIEISPGVYIVEGTPTYKVDITGRTTGALEWVAKVDDRWGAYLDTRTMLPVKGYRNIRENNYKRDEVSIFDYKKKQIHYLRFDHDTGKYRDPQVLTFTNVVRDLVGGYQYLRRLDYDKLSKGDTLDLFGFFEDEFYDFQVLYQGKEKLSTDFGKITAIKLVPVMPDNEIFNGENSIALWISDDANRIPLKIEANMFVGKAGCEIIRYENLKTKLRIAGK